MALTNPKIIKPPMKTGKVVSTYVPGSKPGWERIAAENKARGEAMPGYAYTPEGAPRKLPLGLTNNFDDKLNNPLNAPAEEIAKTYRPSPVALPNAPTPVAGLSNDYFNTQRDQMVEKLRNEFFGPLGTVQSVASQESAAGRLGSGVGKNVIQETAMRPFAEGMVNIGQDVLQAQMQEKARVDEFNATQDAQYRDLSAKVDMYNAGLLNDYEIADLNARIQAYIADEDAAVKREGIQADIYKTDRSYELGSEANKIDLLGTTGQFQGIESSPLAQSLYGSYGVQTPSPTRPAPLFNNMARTSPSGSQGTYGLRSSDGNWITDGINWYSPQEWYRLQQQLAAENR